MQLERVERNERKYHRAAHHAHGSDGDQDQEASELIFRVVRLHRHRTKNYTRWPAGNSGSDV